MPQLRRIRPHFRSRDLKAESVVARELLMGVWGIDYTTNIQHFARPYLNHCNELRSLFQEDGLSEANRRDIIDLVKLVRRSQDKTIKQIEEEIRNAKFHWINAAAADESIRNVLDFAIRLWLFVEPLLSNESLTLLEVVERCLPKRFQPGRRQRKSNKLNTMCTATGPVPGLGSNTQPSEHDGSPAYLPVDFSEKSLTRKGGIKLEWTSYLPDHLSFAGKSRLRVFRHASAIQKHSDPSTHLPYPSGFLIETERTLALLFDPSGNDTSKRTYRIARKNHVDLEAAINFLADSNSRLDLRRYSYWQERLREIRKVYEEAQPKSFRQWWFDRRNRFNWATFWTAVVVFCITLIFGLISSVTGIMQAYASFKALSPRPPST